MTALHCIHECDRLCVCISITFLRYCLPACLLAGLLTALPKAMTKAHSVLVQPSSPGPTTLAFTHYVSFLMAVWSDLIRTVPNKCLDLQDGDPLAPLLLPGAQLAADALRIYAGPGGDAIMRQRVPQPVGRYEASLLLSFKPVKQLQITPQMQMAIAQEGCKSVSLMAIARALLIADTFAITAYNSEVLRQHGPAKQGGLDAHTHGVCQLT